MMFDKERDTRIKVIIPTEWFEKAKDLGVDISLQALAHKLIRQHLTHLELKQELARVNALGGGGDIPESSSGHG
ncbi:hypothetical protein [Stutzerimonas kunmingensis]|uniref:hypothetical protein n=1 Tax=Stutzerimonas kunmingensis TaxID=1211807 RepID=UPI001F2C337E|nr:hypothetical protein [Stutzerimonas kunmingensis]UIP34451.1 hypothetical protein LW136_08460 [Stutzerimonas kunmingensis]